ncbi:RNA polymerase-associated protein RapA [candidate division KSB1 bacterium]|nr:RNA polymerase-associated protein RapA [candidate division KSB1 bacterium]MBL7095043.1 RNA polymerase-associated protein RapA [candidate division KSB1 bacterium]
MRHFKKGQRWISEMEPELGLGIVSEVEQRFVRILFPASDCERLYAKSSAPIKRVEFKVNDVIKSRSGLNLRIESIKDEDGIFIYLGKDEKIPENELSDSISFTTAKDRLLNGLFENNFSFDIRHRALKFQHLMRKSNVRGFVGGRIDLIPHQFYVAHEVASRQIPRVLLSDEVGLGKTIEACLILHRLLIIGRIRRVLVIVPHSLVHQWFIELLRRFNLVFRIFDEEYCESIIESDMKANPFLEDQLGICSVNFLSSSDLWTKHVFYAGWDMVVFDEAHHLTEGSAEYILAKQLSEVSKGLMLLTATPEQLGLRSHFARLHLLDPDRYYDYNVFEKEEQNYQNIAEITNKLLDEEKITDDDIKKLKKILPGKLTNSGKHLSHSFHKNKKNQHQFIENLLDCYGVGRAVFRNTRSAIAGFPKRIAHIIPLETSEKNLKEYKFEFENDFFVEPDSITYDFENDPRVNWIVQFLKQHKKEKVLLICTSLEKVKAIEESLRNKIKVNIVLFHEQLTLLQRDRNAAWFAKRDGAQILICSEIGSEGRNFQFAHHLILFDLPMDPELLEQRIGRLDRIGQKNDIHIHVPYLKGSENEIIVKWYHDGLNGFEINVPGVYQIYQKMGERVKDLALNKKTSKLSSLLKFTQISCAEIANQLEKGRDRLLELNSFRPQIADELIEEVTVNDKNKLLDKFMLNIFHIFGIHTDEVKSRTYKLNLDLLTTPEFPLPAHHLNKIVVTFDRKMAITNENIEFLTWDHPTVIGAIDLILGSEKGNSTVAEMKDDDFSGILLEAIFVLECVAPKNLNIDQFLPPTPIRVLVSHSLENKTETYPEQKIVRKLKNVQDKNVLDHPKIKQELFPKMLETCQKIAESQTHEIIKSGLHQVENKLTKEKQRLIELKKVNANIKKEDILSCQQEINHSRESIKSARLRLDALRFISSDN